MFVQGMKTVQSASVAVVYYYFHLINASKYMYRCTHCKRRIIFMTTRDLAHKDTKAEQFSEG